MGVIVIAVGVIEVHVVFVISLCAQATTRAVAWCDSCELQRALRCAAFCDAR